jgi:hypothetical protein
MPQWLRSPALAVSHRPGCDPSTEGCCHPSCVWTFLLQNPSSFCIRTEVPARIYPVWSQCDCRTSVGSILYVFQMVYPRGVSKTMVVMTREWRSRNCSKNMTVEIVKAILPRWLFPMFLRTVLGIMNTLGSVTTNKRQFQVCTSFRIGIVQIEPRNISAPPAG